MHFKKIQEIYIYYLCQFIYHLLLYYSYCITCL